MFVCVVFVGGADLLGGGGAGYSHCCRRHREGRHIRRHAHCVHLALPGHDIRELPVQ